jgi:hypothetical protein
MFASTACRLQIAGIARQALAVEQHVNLPRLCNEIRLVLLAQLAIARNGRAQESVLRRRNRKPMCRMTFNQRAPIPLRVGYDGARSPELPRREYRVDDDKRGERDNEPSSPAFDPARILRHRSSRQTPRSRRSALRGCRFAVVERQVRCTVQLPAFDSNAASFLLKVKYFRMRS